MLHLAGLAFTECLLHARPCGGCSTKSQDRKCAETVCWGPPPYTSPSPSPSPSPRQCSAVAVALLTVPEKRTCTQSSLCPKKCPKLLKQNNPIRYYYSHFTKSKVKHRGIEWPALRPTGYLSGTARVRAQVTWLPRPWGRCSNPARAPCRLHTQWASPPHTEPTEGRCLFLDTV